MRAFASIAVVVALLAAVPLVTASNVVLNFLVVALLTALVGQGWNLLGGYGGQYSFGHAAFFGTGAYVSTILHVSYGWNPWAAWPVAITAGANLAFTMALTVLCGTGAGIVYATCSATVAKWYPEERGVRVGFVTGAFGFGAVPFIAIFAAVLTAANRAEIFVGVGTCVLVVVGVCGNLLRDPPSGWWPPDIDRKLWAIDKRLNRSLRNNVRAVRQYLPSEAVRTPAFVVMYLILVIAAAASLLAIVYVPFVALYQGLSLGVGALAVGLLAAVNGAGRSVAVRPSHLPADRRASGTRRLQEEGASAGIVSKRSFSQRGTIASAVKSTARTRPFSTMAL